jgi:predicted nucleotidyltransferase
VIPCAANLAGTRDNAFMREQRLIEARDQLLAFAQQVFASNQDVVGVFLSGSLAAGSSDAYSDIDLRVVVRIEDEFPFFKPSKELRALVEKT